MIEQDTVSLATLLVARDILLNPAPALRASAAVKKTEKQLNTLKTSTEYFDAPVDPYPRVTALLAPLLVQPSTGGGFYSGILPL
jgi:hypothetical protein